MDQDLDGRARLERLRVRELGLELREAGQDRAHALDGGGLVVLAGRRAVGARRQDQVELRQVLAQRLPARGGRGQAAGHREHAREARVAAQGVLDPGHHVGGRLQGRALGQAQAEGELALGQVGDEVRAQVREEGHRPEERGEGDEDGQPARAQGAAHGQRVGPAEAVERAGQRPGEHVERPREEPQDGQDQAEREGQGDARRGEQERERAALPGHAVADRGQAQRAKP